MFVISPAVGRRCGAIRTSLAHPRPRYRRMSLKNANATPARARVRTFMGGQMCPSSGKCDNQIVLMTGATGGIGRELAQELCARNVAHLILAARDIKKSFTTKAHLKKLYPNVHIELREVNLESFADIRQFAEAIRKDYVRIDVLINGAGGKLPATITDDGCERNMQVNYLGHFLLTILLLPLLKRSARGRVINFTAHAYASAKFSGSNLLNGNAEQRSDGDAFALSKLAVVASSVALAKTLKGSYFYFYQGQMHTHTHARTKMTT